MCMNNKYKIPFRFLLKLALQGKAVTKILTVFLCAFSFALFALASTGYLYDKKAVYARAVVNYAQETSGAAQITYQPTSAMSGPMGQNVIARSSPIIMAPGSPPTSIPRRLHPISTTMCSFATN